jgi:hypothetical protein
VLRVVPQDWLMVVERQRIAVACRVYQGRLAQRAGARIEGDRLEQVPEAAESNCLQNAAQAPISYSIQAVFRQGGQDLRRQALVIGGGLVHISRLRGAV